MKLFLVNSSGDYPNQFPPLGLLYLASAAREAGHMVSFYDLGAANAVQEHFYRRAEAFAPELFGVSVYTTQIDNTIALFRDLHTKFPHAKILAGGPHVSALPGEILKDCPEVDVEVVGEGERTLCEVLEFFEKKRSSLKEINGICYRGDSGIVQTAPRDHIANLDSIPYPAYDLIKECSYSYDKFAYGRRVGITISSRGCPYNCTFCNKAVFGNRYRRRSPENVVAEIQFQKELLGIDEIYFVDDLFVTNQNWLDAFFTVYKKSGLNLPWKCLGRVDQVDEPVYKRMKEHGCFLVQFGVESGDNEMLKKIRKNITVEKVSRAVTAAQRAGLNVAAYFILGHPGDTYRTVMRTIDFAIALNPDICHFFVLVPFPGTHNYRSLPEELKHSWNRIRYYHKGHYPISMCDLSPEELYHLEKQARYSFYGRITYFTHNILSFRRPFKVTITKCTAFGAFLMANLLLSLLGRNIVSKIRNKANAINMISRDYYDETYYAGHVRRLQNNNRFTKVKLQRLFALLQPRGGELILDLGSGVGTIMLALARVGIRACGLDYSFKSLVIAKNNFVQHNSSAPFSGICCDGKNIAIKDNSFDAIAAVDFTEHLDDAFLTAALSESFRILKNGGRMAIYTPSVTHLFERLKKRNVILKRDNSHIGLRTMEKYLDLLKQCGFTIDKFWFAPTHIPLFNFLEKVLMPIPVLGTFTRRRICIRAVKRV